jgi:hypothetical protein
MSTNVNIIEVLVQSAWWSKVNWTQVVAWICSGLTVWTAGKFNVTPEHQVYIVLIIQGIAGLLTIWFRNTTTTVTPAAAERIKIEQDLGFPRGA